MMPNQQPDLCTQAAELMQEQRFADAVEAFDGHLVREPTDPKALLQLGICHLLDRSEQIFLDIYERVARLIGTLEQIPAEVVRLWTLPAGSSTSSCGPTETSPLVRPSVSTSAW